MHVLNPLVYSIKITKQDFHFLFCCCQNCALKFLLTTATMYMLYIPIGLSVEESARGVDIDHLTVDECPIPFLGVLLGGVAEEPATDGLLNSGSVLTTANHIQLVSTGKEKDTQSQHGENLNQMRFLNRRCGNVILVKKIV